MKNKNRVNLIVFVLLMSVCCHMMGACGKKQHNDTLGRGAENNLNYDQTEGIEDQLLGTWNLVSQRSVKTNHKTSYNLKVLKIYSDGTCFVEGEYGTWKILDGELVILGSCGGKFLSRDSFSGGFTVRDNIMELENAFVGYDDIVHLIYERQPKF